MFDLAASRVLELGIGDVLNLDFSGLGVDDATIFAHDKTSPAVCSELLRAVSARCEGIRQNRHVMRTNQAADLFQRYMR